MQPTKKKYELPYFSSLLEKKGLKEVCRVACETHWYFESCNVGWIYLFFVFKQYYMYEWRSVPFPMHL